MILIRTCAGFDELEACVQMQMETWGYDDSDIIPRKAFLVGAKDGRPGHRRIRYRAARRGPEWDAESMVGFAMSLPGVKTGKNSSDGNPQPYLHSHMLAVREGYRNRGLGAQLKLDQRREALSRGIRLMEWTFDPLEIKNAHLNIHKLGAMVCSYCEFLWCILFSTPRWASHRPSCCRVVSRLERVFRPLEGRPTPVCDRRTHPGSCLHLPVEGFPAIRSKHLQCRRRIAERFQQAFSRGLAVSRFARDEEGNGVFELGRWAQPV